MGEEKLASFFLKVQAVEESFLLLDSKERSRALNILQSSVNKLLNFVGDADTVSAGLCGPDAGSLIQESAPKDCTRNEKRRKCATRGRKKTVGTTRKKPANTTTTTSGSSSSSVVSKFGSDDKPERKVSSDCFFTADHANSQPAGLQQQQTTGRGKHEEDKDNFDDDLQELADFDCSSYDFNPALQQQQQQHSSQASAVVGSNAGGASHMTQCGGGKFAGKMLSMSAVTSEGGVDVICPTSVAQARYNHHHHHHHHHQDQIMDASHDGSGGGCEIAHSHYNSSVLSSTGQQQQQEMKHSCHLSHAAGYGAPQILSNSHSQIDSGAEPGQFPSGVIEPGADPSQYAAGVIDANNGGGGGGGPSQFAGGVIDSSGDPSQYAGSVIEVSSGEASQFANSVQVVMDSSGGGAGEASQYGGGPGRVVVMDSSSAGGGGGGGAGGGEASVQQQRYRGGPGGVVIDMSVVGQEVVVGGGVGGPSGLAQYTGAMIPTAQDVTVCTTAQYAGAAVLAMSLQPTPDAVGYCSAAATAAAAATHFSHHHTVMQGGGGSNCPASAHHHHHPHHHHPHPHFSDTVLDMSTAAAGRHCEAGIAAPPHPPLPPPPPPPPPNYAGTIFEGAVIGTQASVGGGGGGGGAAASTACSPFQFRRGAVPALTEPHEAFQQRSQELTQSLVHASMLQQQQLVYHHQLHQQATAAATATAAAAAAVQVVTGRWRLFVCRACGETFTHHRSIRSHLRTHGSSPLSCRFCRQRHANPVALLHHLCGGLHWRQAAEVSREIFMCRECGKFLASRRRLRQHLEGEHGMEVVLPPGGGGGGGGVQKYTCRFCGLQLTKRLALFLHYRQHACGRFVCRKCGAVLNDFVQYAMHMSRHSRLRRRKTCHQCGEAFARRQRLVEHLQTHQGHTCVKCRKVFPSVMALSKHQVQAHRVKVTTKVMRSKPGADRQCKICGKKFPQGRGLEQHVCLHTGEKSLHCSSCNMRFRSAKALTKHKQTLAHCQRSGKSDENQHLCSECGKAYFRRQALQRHLRQHQSAKRFSCQYCPFRCSERDNLHRHSALHFSTQRNFICELCGAAFHAKKTLEMHHSYKHNSERRFKCPDCPMTFKARNALGRHAKTHSRTREHGCWCGAAFNRLYNLRRHMRLVHGSDDALPPIRKVEVLDSHRSVKKALSGPPAKKMLVKTRKVKADCMQKEQEAAAAAMVVVIGGEEEEEGGGGGGSGEGGGVQMLGIAATLASQDHQQQQVVGMESIGVGGAYSGLASLSAAAAVVASGGGSSSSGSSNVVPDGGGEDGGTVVVGGSQQAQTNALHPLSALPSHPHLTMEQSYAMVSATLHHHHHNLHHHHHHHHDPSATAASGSVGSADPNPLPVPFPHHLSSHPHHHHPVLDYSQLPPMVSYPPANIPIPTSGAAAITTVVDASLAAAAAQQQQQQRQDFYPPLPPPPPSVGGGGGGGGSTGEGGGGGGGMGQQAAEYTTSPFSFIQNFLLPSVGVANLLDLAHASGAK